MAQCARDEECSTLSREKSWRAVIVSSSSPAVVARCLPGRMPSARRRAQTGMGDAMHATLTLMPEKLRLRGGGPLDASEVDI
jgi:hypothetical protein